MEKGISSDSNCFIAAADTLHGWGWAAAASGEKKDKN
jgi:hypothetical protein